VVTRRALLVGGAVAGPVFITAALVEGATRAGYEPLRHPVSSLALGPTGAVQVANFVVTGGLYTGLAVGLGRTPGPAGLPRTRALLIGAAGIGLLGAGVFRTDPVSGYPPGTPDALTGHTRAGRLHDALSIPTFLAIPAAALLHARACRRNGDVAWAVASATSGLAMLGAFGAASGGFSQHLALVNVAGLLQRVSVTAGFGWLTGLAVRALRTPVPA
jgi:hypothetical protein